MKKVFYFLAFLLFVHEGVVAQKQIIRTDKAPVPVGPYSQGVVVNGVLYVAGQLGIDPGTQKLVEGGVEKEFPQLMKNVTAILAAHGLTLKDVVNVTVFMKDLRQFGRVNELYATYFTSDYPARTTVGVSDLPAGAGIEIAVVAAVSVRKRKK
ncbi:Rid family detoxifying hydrolase [Arundinibacter roseus]|uniref:RidA family protein n=1 Tax=Arundinibacter roseus TaxID=2070510 RepID=A0A4R4KHH0_9BACT|nr:Rid family detoxifying hydrolase [Arundinibacter roseus]TDB66049.1 RidA family protein [Arundinibacter roseus]